MFHCESCKFEINNGQVRYGHTRNSSSARHGLPPRTHLCIQNIALCGFCSTKHLKANKEHDVVEFGKASKRDIDEAVRQIKQVEPNYLDHLIANSQARINELTKKAKEVLRRHNGEYFLRCFRLRRNARRSPTPYALDCSETMR